MRHSHPLTSHPLISPQRAPQAPQGCTSGDVPTLLLSGGDHHKTATQAGSHVVLTRGPFLRENTLEKHRRFRHSRDTTCGSQTEAGLGGSTLCTKWPRGEEQDTGQETSVTRQSHPRLRTGSLSPTLQDRWGRPPGTGLGNACPVSWKISLSQMTKTLK